MILPTVSRAADGSASAFVFFQNRGTELVRRAELRATVSGRNDVFTIYNVGVGESAGRSIQIRATDLDGAGKVRIQCSVTLMDAADANPANNSATVSVTLSPL